jgi:hypothetical protein
MSSTKTSRDASQTGQTAEPAYSRRHRRLQIAVWQNDSPKGTFFNTSLQRSYKDGDDWKKSQASLNRDDLLAAAKLLNWAHSAVNAAVASDATPPSSKQPVSSQKYRSLDVAVWRQEGEKGPFFTVSLKRSYKVGEDWNDSTMSLSNDDLLPMAQLLERAHDAIDDLYEDGDFGPAEPAANGNGNEDIPF